MTSLLNQCNKPQFFNIINEEGMFVGQVLANFFIKYYEKDPRKVGKGFDVEKCDEHL